MTNACQVSDWWRAFSWTGQLLDYIPHSTKDCTSVPAVCILRFCSIGHIDNNVNLDISHFPFAINPINLFPAAVFYACSAGFLLIPDDLQDYNIVNEETQL